VSNPERFATAAPSIRQETKALTRESTATGLERFREVQAGVADAVTEVGRRGQEAVQNARAVRDTFAKALLHAIKSHPYAVLAGAGGLGFVAGAVWRRRATNR
jgi:hypothetical protein